MVDDVEDDVLIANCELIPNWLSSRLREELEES